MKQILTLLIFLGFCCTGVRAQDSALPPSSDTLSIESLSADIQRLERRSERWDRVLSALPKVSGYAQVGYEGGTETSSFFVKSVRLSLSGDLGTPKLGYQLQLELAVPRMVDAVITYRPFDALHLHLGEFKLPFTIENTEYTPVRYEFINYSMGLNFLGAMKDLSGISASGRDIGFMASGRLLKCRERYLVKYDLGVFNGEGINLRDKNTSKDVAARLMVFPVRGLMLSGYFYWGETGEHYLKRLRYGGGVCYDLGMFVARGEYVGGTTGLFDNDVISDLKSDGWYVMGGVRPTKKWLIAARYDTFDYNRLVTNTRQTNYTLGITWEPVRFLRCQINYIYEDYASHTMRNRNLLAVALTGIF